MRHPSPRFLCLRCADCAHQKLVAFSCKKRGFCPACGDRRMAETAAHLVDYVIPRVSVRQWVLSFPIPLRLLFAAHPELLTPVLQIIHRVIATFLIKQAGLKRTEADTGAVTLIQRFGSAANLNIHRSTQTTSRIEATMAATRSSAIAVTIRGRVDLADRRVCRGTLPYLRRPRSGAGADAPVRRPPARCMSRFRLRNPRRRSATPATRRSGSGVGRGRGAARVAAAGRVSGCRVELNVITFERSTFQRITIAYYVMIELNHHDV